MITGKNRETTYWQIHLLAELVLPVSIVCSDLVMYFITIISYRIIAILFYTKVINMVKTVAINLFKLSC
jgi:hypothetical protein